MDAERLEGLRQQLRDLDLPPGVVERELAAAVEAFDRPVSDGDRVVVELQRRDVFNEQ